MTIYAPEGAFGLDEEGNHLFRISKMLPNGLINNPAGAGGAFVVDLLYNAYIGIEYRTALSIADAATFMSGQC